MEDQVATTQKGVGRAKWRMRPRFTFARDLLSKGTGQAHSVQTRRQRANTPCIIWAFLYKGPDYVDPNKIGDIQEGSLDIGAVEGDRWVIAADRGTVGQKLQIQVRNIHLRKREKLWLLVLIGRRREGESDPEQDFVHLGVGMCERANYY
jgi:hypothetical protein